MSVDRLSYEMARYRDYNKRWVLADYYLFLNVNTKILLNLLKPICHNLICHTQIGSSTLLVEIATGDDRNATHTQLRHTQWLCQWHVWLVGAVFPGRSIIVSAGRFAPKSKAVCGFWTHKSRVNNLNIVNRYLCGIHYQNKETFIFRGLISLVLTSTTSKSRN